MKVLLINPPRENEIMGNNPPIIEEERGFNPPLGLLYIAGFLEKHTEHNIVIIDSQKGDYTNLAIAYMLARDIAVNIKEIDFDKDLLAIIITRIIKNINDVLNVKNLVENNITNNKEILKQLEKSILLMEFNNKYLNKFLKDGKLTKEDMVAFYMGEEIKDKYKLIEKEIDGL